MSACLIVDVGALLYLGPIGTVPPHRCPSTIVAVGVDGPIELTIAATTRVLRCTTTQAGVTRAVASAAERVAVTLIDPALPARALDDRDAPALICILDRLNRSLAPDVWRDYLAQLGVARPTQALDARVRGAAQKLQAAGDETIGNAAIAAGLGLSASRLEHLFAEQLGIPMRAYRRWCRFQTMARAMAAGGDLTRAAYAAGFHDSAHMNHAFRQAFGIVPSFVFRPDLVVHVVEREA